MKKVTPGVNSTVHEPNAPDKPVSGLNSKTFTLPNDPDAKRVLTLVNAWMELITALNELARSMGHQDFYPFTMSRPVLRKLHFIQLVVKNERETAAAD